MASKNMGVKQLERATTQLSAEGLAELVSWLQNYHAQVWDKRIKEDLGSGRLGTAVTAIRGGRRCHLA